MVSDAHRAPPLPAIHPRRAIIFARFSRSASAWRAIARFILSGSWMSLSSTRVTSTPHSRVITSRISPDVGVDHLGVRQRLVEGVLADNIAQRRLGDLIHCGTHILDDHHRLHRIHDPEIRDSGNVDTDVVTGDDALRLYRHRDDAHRYLPQLVDDRDDERQAGLPDILDPPEPEQHTLLVLGHHPNRQRSQDQRHDDYRNDDGDER